MLRLFHIFCSDAPIACPNLTWCGIPSYTHHLLYSGTQSIGTYIHLLQLLTLNEYAARYAVARHYLGLVDVDE